MELEFDISIRELQSLPDGMYRVTLFAKQDRQVVGEHTVHVDLSYVAELGFTAEKISELLRATFIFLLTREAPHQIIKEFDLRVVSRHFPEYEETMRKW